MNSSNCRRRLTLAIFHRWDGSCTAIPDRRYNCRPNDSRNNFSRILAIICCLLCTVTALLSAESASAADKSIWQMLPYDVKILVALDQCPPLTPKLREELLAGLSERIDATIGATWNTTIEPAPPALRGLLLRDIDAVTVDQIPAFKPPPDKVLLLAVKCLPGGLEVNARDFDVRTNTISSLVTRPVSQIGVLGDAMLDAVLSSFAPLAYIDRVKKKDVLIRPKASALPPRDPNLSFIHIDDVFLPIKRINDKEGNLRKAEAVAWTFLTVERVLSGETTCKLHSGLRSPLYKRGGRRVESLALRVIPTDRSTVLTLKSRTEPHEPLSGYDVYSRVPGKKTATRLGQTNRLGRFEVPPGEHIIRVLLIKNGSEPLYRMPMVPGLERELTQEIAKDDLRLWAEGFMYSMQEEFIDIVIRRIIFMTLIRARMESGKIEQAEKMLVVLREMPNAMQLVLRVDTEWKRLETNDYIVRRKINQRLGDTVQLIHQHLDPKELTELEDDFRDAKADWEREAADKTTEDAEAAKAESEKKKPAEAS